MDTSVIVQSKSQFIHGIPQLMLGHVLELQSRSFIAHPHQTLNHFWCLLGWCRMQIRVVALTCWTSANPTKTLDSLCFGTVSPTKLVCFHTVSLAENDEWNQQQPVDLIAVAQVPLNAPILFNLLVARQQNLQHLVEVLCFDFWNAGIALPFPFIKIRCGPFSLRHSF